VIYQEIKVIESESITAFTNSVNSQLARGWKLSGGMSAVFNAQTSTTTFYQSVVREYDHFASNNK
jgi:hypothetical protein